TSVTTHPHRRGHEEGLVLHRERRAAHRRRARRRVREFGLTVTGAEPARHHRSTTRPQRLPLPTSPPRRRSNRPNRQPLQVDRWDREGFEKWYVPLRSDEPPTPAV